MTTQNRDMFDAERKDDGSVVLTFRPPNLNAITENETLTHLINSQKELLLAARSLLDSAISFLDRPSGDKPKIPHTRINVE